MSACRHSEVVVMAASHGGLKALATILGALPHDFPAPIVVVQHRHARADFAARILSRRTTLAVSDARDGEELRAGTVHVLPPDRQAVIDEAGRVAVGAAGRCYADPVLESVSAAVGAGATAVILSGRLSDGALGARAVKRRGGRVIAQDEATSEAFGMPAATIATGCADFVLPLRFIGPALVALTMVPGAAELFRVRLGPWSAVA